MRRGFRKTNKKDDGGIMKSRKHLRTVLFVAGMLVIGTTMGAALLIERQGGGTPALGKKDGVGGAVGRSAHAPMASSSAYSAASDAHAEAVQGEGIRWSPPGSISWPHGVSGGGTVYGWIPAEYEWPEYYGRPTLPATVRPAETTPSRIVRSSIGEVAQAM